MRSKAAPEAEDKSIVSENVQFDPELREILLRKTCSHLGEISSEEIGVEEVPVVAKLKDPSIPVDSLKIVTRIGQIVTGRIPLNRIVDIRRNDNIISLKASQTYGGDLVFSVPEIHASTEVIRDVIPEGITGCGVIVAFCDWGVDFAHNNLRDKQGKTRLLYLWDQRGGALENSPEPFGYGREFNRDQINNALTQADPYEALGYDPADVDNGTGTHATHVMDIATGNGSVPGSFQGVAPEADLIFVHLKGNDTRLQDTLGDSVRILEAIHYIFNRAGDKPVVINLSLGRTGGPHDASPLLVQAIDAMLEQKAGRAVVMSTGNYFLSGNHSSGRIKTGEHVDLQWQVVPRNDETAEMEIWYPGDDTFTVELIDPRGRSLARVSLGKNHIAKDGGRIIASIYHRQHDPNNGDNQIDIFLWPDAMIGVWVTRVYGDKIANGNYHAWIERDDPGFQSKFTTESVVPTTTIGTLTCGNRTITVGAYDAREVFRHVAPFSSAGPSRDGRAVPIISAPGVGIRAARSSQRREGFRKLDGLTIKSGTSMAAPHVAGTIALMHQVAGKHRLTSDQTREILIKTARSSPPYNEIDHLRYGAGRVDTVASIKAVQEMFQSNSHWIETSSVVPNLDIKALRASLPIILSRLLIEFGDRELKRTYDNGVPIYDKTQPLVFGPTGYKYSISKGKFNYHSANFVYNTAYKLGYDVPVYPKNKDSAKDGRSYNNTAVTFDILSGKVNSSDWEYYNHFFEVVVWPGQNDIQTIKGGDLLLCGTEYGKPFGHIAIIVDPILRNMTSPFFLSRSDTTEGKGVQCIEAGLFIKTIENRFGRLLVDMTGKTLDSRMVIRFKEHTINETRITRIIDSILKNKEEYKFEAIDIELLTSVAYSRLTSSTSGSS